MLPVAVAQRKRLMLELDPDSDPLVGCLRDDRGRTFEFSGWFGFTGALEHPLTPGPAAPPSSAPAPPRPPKR
jgi:hypothetical protein